MARFGTLEQRITQMCPRCMSPIGCMVRIGPGMSIGTSADGTAELTVQVTATPEEHVCSVPSASDGVIGPSAEVSNEANRGGSVAPSDDTEEAGCTHRWWWDSKKGATVCAKCGVERREAEPVDDKGHAHMWSAFEPDVDDHSKTYRTCPCGAIEAGPSAPSLKEQLAADDAGDTDCGEGNHLSRWTGKEWSACIKCGKPPPSSYGAGDSHPFNRIELIEAGWSGGMKWREAERAADSIISGWERRHRPAPSNGDTE